MTSARGAKEGRLVARRFIDAEGKQVRAVERGRVPAAGGDEARSSSFTSSPTPSATVGSDCQD